MNEIFRQFVLVVGGDTVIAIFEIPAKEVSPAKDNEEVQVKASKVKEGSQQTDMFEVFLTVLVAK